MKRVLITGVNSYVGNAFEKYILQWDAKGEAYELQKVSLRENGLDRIDFHGYDSILHVAGIAHADIAGVSEEEKSRYYTVNCELAYETARKAREQGVKQFIYMSSLLVYGESGKVGAVKHITVDTIPAPANFYGDSKWKAEQKLRQLEGEGFRVAMVRAPMIYGKNSKGNFPMVCKFANEFCIFPKVKNARSMIYIENLAEFLRRLIDSGKGGVFLPQNKEYSNTSELVRLLRRVQGKRMYLSVLLGALVHAGAWVPGKTGRIINKAFGSLTIDRALSNEEITEYQLYSLEESIRRIYEG